jgi:disulfide bond formation protein DsbB
MTPFAEMVTTVLAFGTIAVLVITLVLIGLLFAPKNYLKTKKGFAGIAHLVSDNVLELGFVISTGASLASLYYSLFVGFVPCELCWWQRIFLFPQAFMFAVALYYKKKGHSYGVALTTSLILSVLGAAIGLFQYYGAMFNPDLLEACVAQGASCAVNYFTAFGFITIPLMSLVTFALMIVIIVTHKRTSHA